MKAIIFSTDMVKAILEGRKTQTRRVIRPQPELSIEGNLNASQETINKFVEHFLPKCPYGQVGDRLWVRETQWRGGGYVATDKPYIEHCGKIPSIFMPRWASRITLEITGIRVESLNQMTEEDAIRESCEVMAGVTEGGNLGLATARYCFMKLWDSLNTKRGFGWDSNPFCWVLSFRKLD